MPGLPAKSVNLVVLLVILGMVRQKWGDREGYFLPIVRGLEFACRVISRSGL